MTKALPLAMLLCVACEQVPQRPPPPRVVAVDLLDTQELQEGRPTRRRLYTADEGAKPVADSGPDLLLHLYLSQALSAQSLSEAPAQGLFLRDSEGMPVSLRSFLAEAPEAPGDGAPAGAAQALILLPDLRSGRSYILSFDRSHLFTEDAARFDVPPPLRFGTARRFVVLRADPPDGARLRSVALIRLTLSSPARARPSGVYGVVVRADGKPQELAVKLSGNGRQLVVEPTCPLPLGSSEVVLSPDGVEEEGTLAPLASTFRQNLSVTEDPGPCAEAPDLGGADLASRDM